MLCALANSHFLCIYSIATFSVDLLCTHVFCDAYAHNMFHVLYLFVWTCEGYKTGRKKRIKMPKIAKIFTMCLRAKLLTIPITCMAWFFLYFNFLCFAAVSYLILQFSAINSHCWQRCWKVLFFKLQSNKNGCTLVISYLLAFCLYHEQRRITCLLSFCSRNI